MMWVLTEQELLKNSCVATSLSRAFSEFHWVFFHCPVISHSDCYFS